MKESLFLNQFRAADGVATALESFFRTERHNVTGLDCLQGKSSQSLVRKICLPTVACMAINFIFDSRVIGDKDGDIVVGDFYRITLPFHKVEPSGLPKPYDMGWRIVDPLGNTYHHAVAAFLNIFGVKVHSLHNFSGIDQLFDMIPGKKSFLALSLDNRFILEQTLDSGEKELLKKLYPDFGVEKGRHVVLLDGFDSGSVSVVDPFQVLKDGEPPKSKILAWNVMDKALVFSQEELGFPKENLKNIFIPEYVEKDIEVLKKRFLETQIL